MTSELSPIEIMLNMATNVGYDRFPLITNRPGEPLTVTWTLDHEGYELACHDGVIVMTSVAGPDAGVSAEVWRMSSCAE